MEQADNLQLILMVLVSCKELMRLAESNIVHRAVATATADACLRIVLVDVNGERGSKGGPAEVWQEQVCSLWLNFVELHNGCCQYSDQSCMQASDLTFMVAAMLTNS